MAKKPVLLEDEQLMVRQAFSNKKASIFDENKKMNKRNIKEMLQRTADQMASVNASPADNRARKINS